METDNSYKYNNVRKYKVYQKEICVMEERPQVGQAVPGVSGWGSCSVKKVVSVDLIDEVRSEQGTKGGKAQMSPWREGRHSFSSLHLISSTLYSSGLISLS